MYTLKFCTCQEYFRIPLIYSKKDKIKSETETLIFWIQFGSFQDNNLRLIGTNEDNKRSNIFYFKTSQLSS